MHIISGKHAQELYVYFYMLPKASENNVSEYTSYLGLG
jgi:hypothetical protein